MLLPKKYRPLNWFFVPDVLIDLQNHAVQIVVCRRRISRVGEPGAFTADAIFGEGQTSPPPEHPPFDAQRLNKFKNHRIDHAGRLIGHASDHRCGALARIATDELHSLRKIGSRLSPFGLPESKSARRSPT